MYYMDHLLCPNCGHKDSFSLDIATYTANVLQAELYNTEFIDSTPCVCTKCDLKHIIHDRISEMQARYLKLKVISKS